MLKALLISILAGLSYGITGYLKSLKEGKQEKFDPYKFVQTVCVSFLVGLISYMMGWTLEDSYQFVFDVGLVALVEQVKKAIWRRIKPILTG